MVFFKFNRSGDVQLQDSKKEQPPVLAAKPMNKRQLSDSIAAQLGMPVKEIDQVLDCCLATMTAALKDNQPVAISGFGKFKPRKARAGGCRNPKSGKKVAAPKRKSITFRPSLSLKNALM